jgi:peptidyl-prolyl cis-trans isomerase SurA
MLRIMGILKLLTLKKNKMNYRSIALLFSLFTVAIVSGYGQKTYMIDEILGVVGTKPVKLSEVETEYYQQKPNGQSGAFDLKCEIFESLLGQKLLIHSAIVDSVNITEDQVEADLNRAVNSAVEQFGSVEKLEEYYNKSVLELKDELRDSYRDRQRAQAMQRNIVENIKITPSEVADYYNSLPPDSLPYINTQVELSQIAQYPAFSDQAALLAKEKLLDLRKRILEGEKFSKLATLYSNDEEAAKRGGEIGFLPRNELDPEYAKVAFALKKPGDVSRIVESKFGYHIIQLIEKRGDRINTRHILVSPKPDPSAVIRTKQTLDSIALFIRRDSLSFEKAVIFYSADVDTRFNQGMVVNTAWGGTRLDLEQQLPPVDYNVVKKLKVGEISSPYETRDKNGKVIIKIVKLKNIIPAHRANLENDFYIIQEIAKNHKKMKMVDQWLASKQIGTFIFIDKTYHSCTFKSKGWVKDEN